MVRITGIAFGWIRSTTAFGAVVRSHRRGEGRERLRLRTPVALEIGPDARERKQGPVLVEGKPHDALHLCLRVWLRRVFGKTVHRHQTSVLRLQSAPPCGDDAFRILVTGGPPNFGAFPTARWSVRARRRRCARRAPDRGEHARHRRQVADVAVDDAEQRDDRGLVGGDRVEVAYRLISSRFAGRTSPSS
jgi:hypothetical protein